MAAHDASVGGNCKSADITACSSFTTPTGTTIQLGPYGAQMDVNVGKGFENTVPSSDQGTQPSATCQTFANLFMENASLTTELLTTTMNGITVDFSLYSAYRPAVWPSKPVPVITWGNGTCAQPEGYGALLRYVASYGYFVIAANERQVGTADTTGNRVGPADAPGARLRRGGQHGFHEPVLPEARHDARSARWAIPRVERPR